MLQLIFTSTPRGLIQARSGFTTVAMTNGFPKNLVPLVENLSAYERLFAPDDGNADRNPVNYRFTRQQLGSQSYGVLSKIEFGGPGYSRRGAPIASHVLLSSDELAEMSGTPAQALACEENFRWSGQVEYLPMERQLRYGAPAEGGRTWARLLGHAEWARAIAWRFRNRRNQPLFLEFDPLAVSSEELLALMGEVSAWLTPRERAEFTFSTYCHQSSLGTATFIRAYPVGSPFLGSIRRFSEDSIWHVGQARDLGDMDFEALAFLDAKPASAAGQSAPPQARNQTEQDMTPIPLRQPAGPRRPTAAVESQKPQKGRQDGESEKQVSGMRPWMLIAIGAAAALVFMLAGMLVAFMFGGKEPAAPAAADVGKPAAPVVEKPSAPAAEAAPLPRKVKDPAPKAVKKPAVVRETTESDAGAPAPKAAEPPEAKTPDAEQSEAVSAKPAEEKPGKVLSLQEQMDAYVAAAAAGGSQKLEAPAGWLEYVTAHYGEVKTEVTGKKGKPGLRCTYVPSKYVVAFWNQKRILTLTVTVYGVENCCRHGLGGNLAWNSDGMELKNEWGKVVKEVADFNKRQEAAAEKLEKSVRSLEKRIAKAKRDYLNSNVHHKKTLEKYEKGEIIAFLTDYEEFLEEITNIKERKDREEAKKAEEAKKPEKEKMFDVDAGALLSEVAKLKKGLKKLSALAGECADIRPEEDVTKILDCVNRHLNGKNEEESCECWHCLVKKLDRMTKKCERGEGALRTMKACFPKLLEQVMSGEKGMSIRLEGLPEDCYEPAKVAITAQQ